MSKNIQLRWLNGQIFDNEDGFSSRVGVLSYRGVAVAFKYQSYAIGRAVVLVNSEKERLIKVQRGSSFVLEPSKLTAAIGCWHRGGNLGILSLPPASLSLDNIICYSEAIESDKSILNTLGPFKNLKYRYALITDRPLHSDVRMKYLIKKTFQKRQEYLYGSNDLDEVAYARLYEESLRLIDFKAVRERLDEYYRTVRNEYFRADTERTQRADAEQLKATSF